MFFNLVFGTFTHFQAMCAKWAITMYWETGLEADHGNITEYFFEYKIYFYIIVSTCTSTVCVCSLVCY